MTEDQAKTKWCPMVRHVKVGGHIYTNLPETGSDLGDDRCIASECMVWWESGPREGFCGLGKVPKAKP